MWTKRLWFRRVYKKGCKIVDKEKEKIERKLDEYEFPENSNDVDLSEVIKDWFPLGKYHIFLSHSHGDEKKAIAISYYLKEHFGLDCFVDSCVWGYAETLLRKLDEKYCKKKMEKLLIMIAVMERQHMFIWCLILR